MTKSFKAVLLESLLENDGLRNPLTVESLAIRSLEVFRRRRNFISDIREDLRDLDSIDQAKWFTYWRNNPIKAWTGGKQEGECTFLV